MYLLQTHEGEQECLIVTVSTGDGPSEVKIWSRVRPLITLYE